jgi:DNA-binding CsgD family transcriptional regulator
MSADSDVFPELFSDACWNELGQRLHLSRRQQMVAHLLCRGMHTSHVAEDLGVSVNTVRMHQRYLYRRLGVHDRVGLVIRLLFTERELDAQRRDLSAVQPSATQALAIPLAAHGRAPGATDGRHRSSAVAEYQ